MPLELLLVPAPSCAGGPIGQLRLLLAAAAAGMALHDGVAVGEGLQGIKAGIRPVAGCGGRHWSAGPSRLRSTKTGLLLQRGLPMQ